MKSSSAIPLRASRNRHLRSNKEKNVKSRTWMWMAAVYLFAAVTAPIWLVAQDDQSSPKEHHRYKLIDLGTFGGPSSTVPGPNFGPSGSAKSVNNHGTVVGAADTQTADPDGFFTGDSFVAHAFARQKGVTTDLGALGAVPGNNVSNANWIAETGLIAGFSENGVIDPLLPGFPEIRAVLWKDGQIIDLGALGGNESFANAVNNRGQVVGFAENTVPDPFQGLETQIRPFLWQDGVMYDLGDLGGPDAVAIFVNERGQVAGSSLINSTPVPPVNGPCALGGPPSAPFLWENGRMIGIGTLGGSCGTPNALNNRGQVVGDSFLAGDSTYHPFSWDRGVLTDLGTLGGDNGQALWVNDAGEVIGQADLPGSIVHHGFLWRNAVMTDLGTLGSTSFAEGINSNGQVVGRSRTNDPTNPIQHAFLWEDGGPMIDLNTLILAHSSLLLLDATYINDRGEIAGHGLTTNGENHAFLLIPCKEGEQGCGDNAADSSASTEGSPVAVAPHPSVATALSARPRGMLGRLRSRWSQPYHAPSPQTGPAR
jgi:probable HAF family extracellular repeat protein